MPPWPAPWSVPFAAISKVSDRVSQLEKSESLQQKATDWVMAGVWAVVGAAGVSLLKGVF